MLIVCGSATSWIMDNLMNNKGGLYGRVTSEIHLHPMTVAECSEFLTYRNIVFGLYDIIQCYMILGGIPYYMNMLRKDLSLAANIDLLFFNKDSRLANELDRLMGSLFKHPENYIKAVRLLSGKRIGYTRGEIASETGIKSGGGLTTILKALEETHQTSPNGSKFGLIWRSFMTILCQSQDIFTGRMRPFSSNSRRSMQTTRLSPSVDPSGWRW